ncbi:MAG: hypothetical protein ACYS6K_21780 [Planctomycetota bacterium]|jgi:hypothetical protein
MRPLKNRQKELLFDYCVGITSEEETAKVKELISFNKEAAEIHRKLKAALTPLESVRPELCRNVEGPTTFLPAVADSPKIPINL